MLQTELSFESIVALNFFIFDIEFFFDINAVVTIPELSNAIMISSFESGIDISLIWLITSAHSKMVIGLAKDKLYLLKGMSIIFCSIAMRIYLFGLISKVFNL